MGNVDRAMSATSKKMELQAKGFHDFSSFSIVDTAAKKATLTWCHYTVPSFNSPCSDQSSSSNPWCLSALKESMHQMCICGALRSVAGILLIINGYTTILVLYLDEMSLSQETDPFLVYAKKSLPRNPTLSIKAKFQRCFPETHPPLLPTILAVTITLTVANQTGPFIFTTPHPAPLQCGAYFLHSRGFLV